MKGSIRLYRLLLCFYPRRFRDEYGALMMGVFRDECLEARRRAGLFGLVAMWGRTSVDLFLSSVHQHLDDWNAMKTISLISILSLGAGLAAGAASFIFHSSAGALFLLMYLCVGLILVHAALAFFQREVTWWKELVAAAVVWVAFGLFLPWWAKMGQGFQIRPQTVLVMAPLAAMLAVVVTKGFARLWPRLTRRS